MGMESGHKKKTVELLVDAEYHFSGIWQGIDN